MTDEVFNHSEGAHNVQNLNTVIGNKGLKCVWTSRIDNGRFYLKWAFNWDELKAGSRICGLKGQITCQLHQTNYSTTTEVVEVDVANEDNKVEKVLPNHMNHNGACSFTYALIPILSMTEFYDEMFLESEKTDSILLVDGMKLNVNKTFLSFHSDFFQAMFSSNFKEGQMDEIPVKDVTYEEIGMLLSTIYPKTIFPNDRIIPKLLELADRFLMPSVIHHVEYHLLNNSKIDNEKMIWMADRYGMELLFEKMIKALDTVAKAKKLKESPDYKDLSAIAKARILDKVMTFI